MDRPTIKEIQEQTRELTLAIAKVLPRGGAIPAAVVRAFARVTAATIGAVADPVERGECCVQASELWCEELKTSMQRLYERDAAAAAEEGDEPCGS